jgi:hemoglobin
MAAAPFEDRPQPTSWYKAPEMTDKANLYERIGGEEAIMAAVDIFYDKVLADDRTRRFFDGIDMAAQSRKQVAFMTWAFDGPKQYRGRDLREAHKDLNLDDGHFDAVAEHLQATLEELGVGAELVKEVLEVIEGTRRAVLNR